MIRFSLEGYPTANGSDGASNVSSGYWQGLSNKQGNGKGGMLLSNLAAEGGDMGRNAVQSLFTEVPSTFLKEAAFSLLGSSIEK